MVNYKIYLINDMGNLVYNTYVNNTMIRNTPKDIVDFVYVKSKNKIFYATDTDGIGCLFYILKFNLQDNWTYNYKGDTVTIDYSKLHLFHPGTMKISHCYYNKKK